MRSRSQLFTCNLSRIFAASGAGFRTSYHASLKPESAGRITAAAQVNTAKVQTAELKALVSGQDGDSIQSRV
jgi:hypothetical protein